MKFLLRLNAAKWRLFVGTLVLLLAGYVSIQYWQPVDAPPTPSLALSQASHDSPGAPVAQEAPPRTPAKPGMEVYIDPKTGQFRKPPVGKIPGGVQTSPPSNHDEGARPRSSRKGLEEQESPVAGGGIVTNVHLRFRRPLVASRDENGKLTIQHVPQEADLNGER